MCQRCHATENQEADHQWGQWAYATSDSCDQMRKCQRCHATQKREADHQWGQWAYAASDSCDQVRMCQRCGTQESRPGEHVWDVWVYEGPTSCNQLRFCRRCGARELKGAGEMEHDWSTWTAIAADPPNQEERTCQRCHEQETRALGPSPGD